MATPTYQEARKKFFGTGYELRDYLARVISGKNPDGTVFDQAQIGVGVSGGATIPNLRTQDLKMAGAVLIADINNTYAEYWGTNFSPTFIDKQVNALKVVGANSCRVVCDTSGVFVGSTTSLAQNVANVKIVLDKLLAANIYAYVTTTSNNPYLSSGRATLSQELQSCAALCTAINGYSNVIGIDLFNEINEWQVGRGGPGTAGSSQPDATSKSWMAQLFAAARANTSKPLTFSLYTQDVGQLTANTAADWLPNVVQYSNYLDIHPYYYVGAEQPTDMPVADIAALHKLYPDLNIYFGEVSVPYHDASTPEVARRMLSLSALCRLNYVTGAAWYTLNDYSSPGGVGTGMIGQDMLTPRTNLTVPFSYLPKVTPWPIVPVGGSGGGTLTTPDVAGNDTGLLTGSTAIAAGNTGYTNSMSFTTASDQIQFADNFRPAGSQAFTVEFLFKRARNGVAETLVAQWANSGVYLDANWTVGFTAANKPITSWIDGAGNYAELQSTSAVVTDSNWHWLCISWDGTAVRLFIDGVGVSGVETSRQTGKNTQPIIMGGVVNDTVGFRGQIDELRISNVARYVSANYTVPTAPFTTDSNTKRLVHCDVTNSA